MLLQMENISRNNRLSAILLFAFFFFGCDAGSSSGKTVSTYIGVYQVDLDKSIVGEYIKDSSNFENFTLTISPDESFSFSMDLPFIRKQKGNWKIRSIDGIDFLYLVYGKGPYGSIEDEVNLTIEKDIFIINTRPKIDTVNVQKLFFKRINGD